MILNKFTYENTLFSKSKMNIISQIWENDILSIANLSMYCVLSLLRKGKNKENLETIKINFTGKIPK